MCVKSVSERSKNSKNPAKMQANSGVSTVVPAQECSVVSKAEPLSPGQVHGLSGSEQKTIRLEYYSIDSNRLSTLNQIETLIANQFLLLSKTSEVSAGIDLNRVFQYGGGYEGNLAIIPTHFKVQVQFSPHYNVDLSLSVLVWPYVY
ncbi:hypothetical protein GJ496_005281 [Pomphorhynchus laevis]|nr:hypothetical protein GJ496_005281 [Pomphorhynchus laevis]